MGLGYELLGFDSVQDYGAALKGLPKNGAKRVFQRQSAGKFIIVILHIFIEHATCHPPIEGLSVQPVLL
jgi:hypothetical protein